MEDDNKPRRVPFWEPDPNFDMEKFKEQMLKEEEEKNDGVDRCGIDRKIRLSELFTDVEVNGVMAVTTYYTHERKVKHIYTRKYKNDVDLERVILDDLYDIDHACKVAKKEWKTVESETYNSKELILHCKTFCIVHDFWEYESFKITLKQEI